MGVPKVWRAMVVIPNEWRAAVHNLYKQVKAKIRTKEGLLECFNNDIRVKQSCSLSPTLFGLHINKIEEWKIQRRGAGVTIA
jgi:hypothetical protein